MSTFNLTLFQNERAKKIVPAGANLFETGDPGVYMFVLISGEARIIVNDIAVETAFPGAVIGEMAIIDGEPRSADVRCITDCIFAQIDRPRFEFLIRQHPDFALEVMKIMSERLRSTNKLL
ncbi:MAG TPA: cyclic nucleotide-binding domain-containing protein [bacterium]|nr:cyclic nucleotide-binding domain-containing protein [bacterium]